MKTVNSLSGGKTSSYIAANYPADYDVFSLVRIEDKNAMFPDKKIRKEIEDRIQAPFIGTAEDDMIVYTMLDLEQFIGRKITWVTGKTFDKITTRKDKVYLPNKVQRFCTVEMKIEPMFYWWAKHIGEPIEMRIGFRANETRRAKNMLERCNADGLSEFKATFGKHKDGRNKWEDIPYQKPSFPLIDSNVYKDTIEQFWLDKPVRFAWMNNCVGWRTDKSIVLFVTHDFKDDTRDIPLSDCSLNSYYYNGSWQPAKKVTSLKTALNELGDLWDINKLRV